MIQNLCDLVKCIGPNLLNELRGQLQHSSPRDHVHRYFLIPKIEQLLDRVTNFEPQVQYPDQSLSRLARVKVGVLDMDELAIFDVFKLLKLYHNRLIRRHGCHFYLVINPNPRIQEVLFHLYLFTHPSSHNSSKSQKSI